MICDETQNLTKTYSRNDRIYIPTIPSMKEEREQTSMYEANGESLIVRLTRVWSFDF
jgi:CMP-N-acetylneuraminic acid synthetase